MATIVGPGTLPARKLEDLSAFDAVGIQCRQTVSPECGTVFKASPSFRASFTNAKVNLSKLPSRASHACRKHARSIASSMVTSMPTDMSPVPDDTTDN